MRAVMNLRERRGAGFLAPAVVVAALLCATAKAADEPTLRLVQSIKSGKFAGDADTVRYQPATHMAYVAHAEKAPAVIDAKTYQVKADIKLPGQAESSQLEKGRPRLYLNTPSPAQVNVIDTEKNQVTGRFPLQGAAANYPLALD